MRKKNRLKRISVFEYAVGVIRRQVNGISNFAVGNLFSKVFLAVLADLARNAVDLVCFPDGTHCTVGGNADPLDHVHNVVINFHQKEGHENGCKR